MKRLWLVTELFYPEETSTAYILTKIANQLAKNMEIHVICGPAFYQGDKIKQLSLSEQKELDPRIIIHRVSDIKLDKNKILARIIRFLILSWKLSFTLWRNIRPKDEIFIVTNPAPLLLLVSFIKKMKGNKLYVLVHDVFPENTIPAQIMSSKKNFLFRTIKYWFDKAYRQADTLIVLGRDMQEVMSEKLGKNHRKTKVEIIENWSEIDLIHANYAKDFKLCSSKKIDIQYAGNLGRVQGLMFLLEVIKEANNQDLRFSFWGDGAIKDKMQEYVRNNDLTDIEFKGNYKRIEQSEVLNNCDLAIITLADGMRGLGVPSKSYNILAAGKPILYIGDLTGEIALLIQEYDIGYCFDSCDREGIRNFLSSIKQDSLVDFIEKGKRARKLAEERYAEKLILKKFTQLILNN